MPPPFIFRIDEIREAQTARVTKDIRAEWVPSLVGRDNVRVREGVTGQYFYCNGQQIGSTTYEQFPSGAECYQTYSMFYLGGFGFWVLKGDATCPDPEATWQPLQFEHDVQDGHSSYLCNVSQSRVLACQRTDQHWLGMLLPDVNYHSSPSTPYTQYGALKGELGIFLALIAFAVRPTQLQSILPVILNAGKWQTFQMAHGREERRGVVVSVYTWPPQGSKDKLTDYESGRYLNEKYFY